MSSREIHIGKYKSEITIGEYKAENTHPDIHIGSTGRKIQIGKYTSDNTDQEIHIVTLQIDTKPIGKYNSKKSDNTKSENTNRKYKLKLEHSKLENTNQIFFGTMQTGYYESNIHKDKIQLANDTSENTNRNL